MKNDGTELRITKISEDDIGDYTCIAENSEGKKHATTKVILAGERSWKVTGSGVWVLTTRWQVRTSVLGRCNLSYPAACGIWIRRLLNILMLFVWLSWFGCP